MALDDGADVAQFWEMREEIKSFARFERLGRRDRRLGVDNQIELGAAQWAAKRANGWISVQNHALPDGFLKPRLIMPEKGFAADYFILGPFRFASARLRAVMAQPAEVVQWVPINLLAGGEAVRAQDYRWMRVLAVQEAIDMERSEYTPVDDHPDIITGVPRRRILWPKRLALLEGLVARTEIFCPREIYATWLATDALAERVLRAGCTGVAFVDPEAREFGDVPKRYRTATGVVEH